MVPLFPTITPEDGSHQNPRPISIQKLVTGQPSASQHQFKHLPADRLESAVRRAAADLQLERTTRSLLQALNLQAEGAPPAVERAEERRRRHGPFVSEHDKTVHSDSEVSSTSHRQNHEACGSTQHLPTASTLLSEQATQTGASADGAGSSGQLPSLHLLRTLQTRLSAALRQISQLRAQGPWQGRVLDQTDWDRKLARMDEFHAKTGREMYVLTRQVDLIMESACSIPRTRVTSSLRGDVIRKLVRAYRSALRVTQAFVQHYWDGSLDGRRAGRFLQLLSVCRSLADVCRHLELAAAPDIADLPERLACEVRQHATTASDVGSLIREMALGRFGPAAAAAVTEARSRQPRPAARPGAAGSRSHPLSRQSHKVKSTVSRLRSCRETPSVRSAPAVRRPLGPHKGVRPGSAPHARAKTRPRRCPAPLPPLPEERDSYTSEDEDRWTTRRDPPQPGAVVWSGWDRPDQGGLLAAAVESLTRQAHSNTAADTTVRPTAPGCSGRTTVSGPSGGTDSADRTGREQQRRTERRRLSSGAVELNDRGDSERGGDDEEGAAGEGSEEDETSGRRRNQEVGGDRRRSLEDRARPNSGGTRQTRGAGRRDGSGRRRKKEANHGTQIRVSRARRQLRHVLIRLDALQREREAIRRRWEPLIRARENNEDETMYQDVNIDLEEPASLAVPLPALYPTGSQPTASYPEATPLSIPPPPPPPPPHADAATSTSGLTAPVPPPPGPGLGSDQRRSVRDVFVSEALDPRLRSGLTEQLRGVLGSSEDAVIKSLPEETVHQLVDEFISEAGVDIFLHQLFDQEFEMHPQPDAS